MISRPGERIFTTSEWLAQLSGTPEKLAELEVEATNKGFRILSGDFCDMPQMQAYAKEARIVDIERSACQRLLIVAPHIFTKLGAELGDFLRADYNNEREQRMYAELFATNHGVTPQILSILTSVKEEAQAAMKFSALLRGKSSRRIGSSTKVSAKK